MTSVSDGECVYQKRFAKIEDAISHVKELREKLHGEFCNHGSPQPITETQALVVPAI